MNPPRSKLRGITERGFAPITAGGIHPRGKPRGIEPSRLKTKTRAVNITKKKRADRLPLSGPPIAFLCYPKISPLSGRDGSSIAQRGPTFVRVEVLGVDQNKLICGQLSEPDTKLVCSVSLQWWEISSQFWFTG